MREWFGVDVATLTFVVFTLSGLLALVVSAPLLLWAEWRRRGRMIALGLFGMAASLALCGVSGSMVAFGLAFALYAPACDLACGLAQAALMDLDPEQRERRMAAWTLAGTVGDLVAPLAIAVAVLSPFGFRAVWFAVAAGLFVMGALIFRLELTRPDPEGTVASRAPSDSGSNEPAPGQSLLSSLRSARNNRPLLLWLSGVALCCLMDETLTVLAALWARERFPETPHAVALLLTLGTLGSIAGLVALDRLLVRREPRRLLIVATLGTVLAYLGMLASSTLLGASACAFVSGLFIAWHYPIAQAQAYRAAAQRSGLVAALSAPLSTLELIAPVVLGFAADRFGITLALGVLLLQPLGLFVIAMTPRLGARGR